MRSRDRLKSRLDSEMLRGFSVSVTEGQTDRQADICDCRVPFATDKNKLPQIIVIFNFFPIYPSSDEENDNQN